MPLPLVLAAALALAAQGPAAPSPWGWVRPTLDSDGAPRRSGPWAFVPDGGGEPTVIDLYQLALVLESDPECPIAAEAAVDRRCRFAGPVPTGDLTCAASVPRLIVRGGIAPARFRAAMDATGAFGPPRRSAGPPAAPDPFLRALVARGLADRRYRARRLAGRLLVAHGEAAVAALVEGLASGDMEVRERSLMALDELRTGTIYP